MSEHDFVTKLRGWHRRHYDPSTKPPGLFEELSEICELAAAFENMSGGQVKQIMSEIYINELQDLLTCLQVSLPGNKECRALRAKVLRQLLRDFSQITTPSPGYTTRIEWIANYLKPDQVGHEVNALCDEAVSVLCDRATAFEAAGCEHTSESLRRHAVTFIQKRTRTTSANDTLRDTLARDLLLDYYGLIRTFEQMQNDSH